MRKDSWTGKWIKERLIEKNLDEIVSIEIISSNFISVIRKEKKEIKTATMSLSNISENDLKELLGNDTVAFVINTLKEPYITGDALSFASSAPFGLGGFADFMRALREDEPECYLEPEAKFICRGLNQHNKVLNVERLDNRRYCIQRYGLPTLTIVALNDYHLTAESVRNAIDKYKDFQAILTSNPNCSSSSNAFIAAQYAGLKIFKWGELLGALNKIWN